MTYIYHNNIFLLIEVLKMKKKIDVYNLKIPKKINVHIVIDL